MGELVGVVVGVVLWTELWAWLCRKLGARPTTAVVIAAGITVVLGIVITALTGHEYLLVGYGLGIPAWSGYRFWSARQMEVRDQAAIAHRRALDRMEDEREEREERAKRKAKRKRPKQAVPADNPPIAAPVADAGLTPVIAPIELAAPTTGTDGRARGLCGTCGTQNEHDAVFCDRCGSDLRRVVCTRCKTPNRAEARHCKQCGAPIGCMEAKTP